MGGDAGASKRSKFKSWMVDWTCTAQLFRASSKCRGEVREGVVCTPRRSEVLRRSDATNERLHSPGQPMKTPGSSFIPSSMDGERSPVELHPEFDGWRRDQTGSR